MAVRTLSTLMSPVGVLDVMTPGPVKRTLKGAFEKGARRHNGSRKKLMPRAHVAGISCRRTPALAPWPEALPVIRPGL